MKAAVHSVMDRAPATGARAGYILQRVLTASEAVRDRAGDQRRDSDHHGHRQMSEAWLANRSSRIGGRTFQHVPRRNPVLDAL